MRMANVHEFRAKTMINAWHLNDKNLEMADLVRLYALNNKNHRIRDVNMTISNPVNLIRWSGGKVPRAFRRNGNHGITIISIMRNHDIGVFSGSELTTVIWKRACNKL